MQLIVRDRTSYSVFEKCLFLDYHHWSANQLSFYILYFYKPLYSEFLFTEGSIERNLGTITSLVSVSAIVQSPIDI